jgi:hypothetical protein
MELIRNDSQVTTQTQNRTQENYQTPLAKWARLLEIIIPAYMLGKSWGIAQPHSIDLFKAQFPTWLITAIEWMKGLFPTNSVELQRLISTTSGAVMGFFILLMISTLIHFILRDRRFIDSLRFTAITLLPIAVLNGTLSHGLQTLIENSTVKTVQALTVEAVYTPWSYFAMNLIFYLAGLWVMGKRTGVAKQKRYQLLGAGVLVMGLYLVAGFMIFPGEWQSLVGKLVH